MPNFLPFITGLDGLG